VRYRWSIHFYRCVECQPPQEKCRIAPTASAAQEVVHPVLAWLSLEGMVRSNSGQPTSDLVIEDGSESKAPA
jgi:hypothetical protein